MVKIIFDRIKNDSSANLLAFGRARAYDDTLRFLPQLMIFSKIIAQSMPRRKG
jgi:hypothetical protein